jgi:predicted dehydrogenase
MNDLQTIRWGIIGPGSIAKSFCRGVAVLPDHQVVAVGSRTQEKADVFGEEFHVPRRHGSYQALVEDPEVDAVYVATPHPYHQENALQALDAGKPVLCEKPFTLNEGQLSELVEVARSKNLFLMEGMWTRFFPLMYRVRELLKEGAIGEVRMVQADFGFRAGFDPKGRLFAPELGGGSLLDVGIYVLSLSSMVLGEPDRITGVATIGETGVDEQAAVTLGHPSGAVSLLFSAVRTNTPHVAYINGTDGRITIHSPFWKPEKLTLSRSGQPDELIELPMEGSGFNYEIAEVGRCLRAGKTESDVMPLDESLSLMRTMDRLREQWGIRYPTE